MEMSWSGKGGCRYVDVDRDGACKEAYMGHL